jgi:ATP-dependent RNA helicase DeaD
MTRAPARDDVKGFGALGLGPRLVSVVEELGYEEPTPIQRDAIPALLEGRDVVGQAGTGTGKTAAFALPLLQRALDGGKVEGGPSVLVLVPTRELAMQVAEATYRYGRKLGARVLPIYGGQPITPQLRGLERGVDVVVATPGRALDHVRRRTLDLGRVKAVVLDEADEMLDMGFADELEAILGRLPAVRQTALFTATMPQRITAIAERHLRNPMRIAIPEEAVAKGAAPRVRQVAFLVSRAQKVDALGRILDLENPASALVFCRTRGEVETLTDTLNSRGYKAEALHGGMSQNERDRVMRRFREGKAELLLATDVAARGLDIGRLSHVINYDVPPAPESYVHRIGRTGRAGRAGVAITLAEPRERSLLRNIERLIGRRLEMSTVPSRTDLRARRLEVTRSSLREAVAAGGNEAFRPLVQSLSPEFDLVDVAAAALRLLYESGDRAADVGLDAPSSAKDAPSFPTGSARLYVSIGKEAGVEQADLVRAMTGGSTGDGGAVGAVEIEQRFSLVDVREDRADAILEVLRASTIRGQRVTASRYNPDKDKKKKKTSGAARARERKARMS